MPSIKKLALSTFLAASVFACASTEYSANPISASPSKSNDTGYITKTGLVINWNNRTGIFYDEFMGEQCLKILRRMGNPLHEAIRYSECNPQYKNDYRYAAFCQQASREVQQLKANEQHCLQKRQVFQNQKIYVRTVKQPRDIAFPKAGSIVASGALSQKDKSTSIYIAPQAEIAKASCLYLTNEQNEKVPVRGADHAERYLFSMPHMIEASHLKVTEDAIKQAQLKIYELRNKVDQAQAYFKEARAYADGQCQMPAQRTIPPKPAGMSEEELQFQVESSCIDLLVRRFPDDRVENALFAINRDNQIEQWVRWSTLGRKNQAQCAKNSLSQAETMIPKIVCGVFGGDISNICIQQLYDQCVISAESRCNGPVQAWERKRRKIIAEPREIMSDCQARGSHMKQHMALLRQAHIELNTARDRLRQLKSKNPVPVTDRVSLEEAVCKA